MVSSLLSDALTDPTAVLVDIFQNTSDLDQFPLNVATHFQHVFSTEDTLKEIPSIHVHNPPHLHKVGSLVRFDAMIQDTSLSQEVYLAKSADGFGGWGLAQSEVSREIIDYTNLRERSVSWAVTVPGQNSWFATLTDDFAPKPPLNATYQSSQPHKYPIVGAPHVGVQVKIYNSRDAEILRSTDLLTFVGILTSEPLHADIESPSPAMVPSLHVLFLQHLPPTIIPCSFPYLPPGPMSVNGIRDELIAWIADQALAGDRMTAEWILLCVIARVQSRNPPMLPPSLTISRFPPPIPDSSPVPSLCHVLSHILPLSSMLPLSLAILNTTAFAPESKGENLSSGWLQLPKGSACVITENMVTEGVVSEQGITNLRIMQDMINTQTLEYVFPYSRFVFDTDIGVFILSEGKKSALFQTHINVALRNAATTDVNKTLYKPAHAIALPAKEKLDMFRKFVCSGKIGSVSVSDETAKFIQEDFVNERRAAPEPGGGFTPDDLIQRLMVTRLLALSLQENEINIDIWERAKGLEAARKARIQ